MNLIGNTAPAELTLFFQHYVARRIGTTRCAMCQIEIEKNLIFM